MNVSDDKDDGEDTTTVRDPLPAVMACLREKYGTLDDDKGAEQDG